jgi:phosphoenolpyruvate synthase/pyruvate phosphate dikinase
MSFAHSNTTTAGASFVFGTKAETLARLEQRLSVGRLCEQYFFDKAKWDNRRDEVLATVMERFAGCRLAVRSSAQGEDNLDHSMAGAFESVVGVSAGDSKTLAEAIGKVFASYPNDRSDDQVLVQPFVEDVALAGVAMSREISTGGPYFVINYDDFSGRTDTVTGGGESKTMMVLRSRTSSLHSPRIATVIDAVEELEDLTGCDRLDVEFCTTRQNELYILQIRRMSMQKQWAAEDVEATDRRLARVRSQIQESMRPVAGLSGSRTIFSEMADWNPAEMIGTAPKPLAYSLYRTLITDAAWARARAQMGYRDVGDVPLMREFAGRPYIDVRLSLNSFLPAGIAPSTADKLVEFQLEKLTANREHHDKIEFEIAIPCLDLNFADRQSELTDAGLTTEEIGTLREQLLTMTDRFIRTGPTEISALLEQAETLTEEIEPSIKMQLIDQISLSLERCRCDGVVPFAKLARHAFVAMAFLQSMRKLGVLDEDADQRFFGSIHTVTSEFVQDLWALSQSEIREDAFLSRYGHLRPGTYDIVSLRYDEAPETYLDGAQVAPHDTPPFELTDAQRSGINSRLKAIGFSVTADELFAYMADAIRGRELCKFLFTRQVSDCLRLLAAWGRPMAFSREDLAYLHIDEILSRQIEGKLRDQIETARVNYLTTSRIRLPHLIETAEDVDVIRIPIGHPTFISSVSVSAPCQSIETLGRDVDGKIVLIESADPGYDWIFSHPIAGLITKFGGANSHMGIRCAEFGIPAAIGCGDRIYQQALEFGFVDLDCAVRVIRFPSKH